jgi:hypothetical protein
VIPRFNSVLVLLLHFVFSIDAAAQPTKSDRNEFKELGRAFGICDGQCTAQVAQVRFGCLNFVISESAK